MYPTVYHALLDLFGLSVPALKLVNMFGFMVVLAFLGAARTLRSELARKGRAGILPTIEREALEPPRASVFDMVSSALVMGLFAFKLGGVAFGQYELEGGADSQRYLFSLDGNWSAGIVVFAGAFFLSWRARAAKPEKEATAVRVRIAPEDHTFAITGAAALGGLIGAKVFHWLETPEAIWDMIRHPTIDTLFSGLTIYGGLIVGAASVYRYSRKQGLAFAPLCDATAPGLMLAYGVGRLGCQLAGDGDWGIPSVQPAPAMLAWLPDWFWAFDFPNNVIRAGQLMESGGFPGYGTHLVPAVYPTPLYEALLAFVFFGLLWALRLRVERPLVVFSVYLMFNGFARFWVEKIRVNATYDLAGFAVTQAEIISVVMFIGGGALLYRQLNRPAPTTKAV